jgi:hypothetical protein
MDSLSFWWYLFSFSSLFLFISLNLLLSLDSSSGNSSSSSSSSDSKDPVNIIVQLGFTKEVRFLLAALAFLVLTLTPLSFSNLLVCWICSSDVRSRSWACYGLLVGQSRKGSCWRKKARRKAESRREKVTFLVFPLFSFTHFFSHVPLCGL